MCGKASFRQLGNVKTILCSNQGCVISKTLKDAYFLTTVTKPGGIMSPTFCNFFSVEMNVPPVLFGGYTQRDYLMFYQGR
jgi:hypothetical protein